MVHQRTVTLFLICYELILRITLAKVGDRGYFDSWGSGWGLGQLDSFVWCDSGTLEVQMTSDDGTFIKFLLIVKFDCFTNQAIINTLSFINLAEFSDK